MRYMAESNFRVKSRDIRLTPDIKKLNSSEDTELIPSLLTG